MKKLNSIADLKAAAKEYKPILDELKKIESLD